MKRNYLLGIMVMIGTLFLNYPGFTQVTKFDVNQGTSKPKKIYFGLQTDSGLISHEGDVADFEGYCSAFIEVLKKRYTLNIEEVPVETQKRFTGIGMNGQKLDAECGPDTITKERVSKDLKKPNGRFSIPFAYTATKILVSDEKKIYFSENNQEKLKTLKFGVLNGTTAKAVVENRYRYNDNIINLENRHSAIEQINEGKIDAYFNDEPILIEMINSLNKQKKYSILPGRLSEEDYGIVVFHVDQNKNHSLLEQINILLPTGELKSFGDTQIRMFNDPAFQEFSNKFRQDIQGLNPPVDSSKKNPPVDSSKKNPPVDSSKKNPPKNNRHIIYLGLFFIFLFIVIVIVIIRNRRRNLSRIHTLLPELLRTINFIMHNNFGINVQGNRNSGIAGGGSVANLGTISGNVSIAINQLPDSPDTENPGIKELLMQLHSCISQSTDLSDEEKAEALKQVKALAEAGTNPQESTKQKMAKTAITMLKGIFTDLPAIASLFEASNKLLPAISKLFGLG